MEGLNLLSEIVRRAVAGVEAFGRTVVFVLFPPEPV